MSQVHVRVIGVMCACLCVSSCTGGLANSKKSLGSDSDSAKSYAMKQSAELAQKSAQGQLLIAGQKIGEHLFFFPFDNSVIQEADYDNLNAQATFLLKHPEARIRLEGNTDERGSREYNIALGWRRARAVSAYLLQQGVDENQLSLLSLGKEKPLAYEHNESAWQKNRRVRLVYEVY